MRYDVNIQETDGGSVTVALPKDGRSQLIALRSKYGADSPIGYRCSNLIELLDCPYPPIVLIRRQMAELQALLKGGN